MYFGGVPGMLFIVTPVIGVKAAIATEALAMKPNTNRIFFMRFWVVEVC
jgi:hypothetical protein